LSEQDNAELYGKCNNPYGHGHDYVLEVSVKGPVDAVTGRLVSIGALDGYVHERVIEPMDHRDLNQDVFGPDAPVPTTENLAIEVARRLRESWPASFGGAVLDRVWIQETKRNTFELREI
jgi:6-pyruvoyltetrahydropterin/6-carboxytetrahydropterin synthase